MDIFPSSSLRIFIKQQDNEIIIMDILNKQNNSKFIVSSLDKQKNFAENFC